MKHIRETIPVLFLLLSAVLPAAHAKGQNDEKVYQARLEKFVNYMQDVSKMKTPSRKALNKVTTYYQSLVQFAIEYPKSKYADDAEFIGLMTKAASAAPGDIDAVAWDDFAQKYPFSRISELTLRAMSEINAVSFEYYLPYAQMPLEAKIMKALFAKQYERVIVYSEELLKNIDLRNNAPLKDSKEAGMIYARILVSCKELNKKEDFDRFLQEAVSIFPEQEKLFKEIWP